MYLRSQLANLGQSLCEALSGMCVGAGAGMEEKWGGRGRPHKVFGKIGLEIWLPWQHITPIDL